MRLSKFRGMKLLPLFVFVSLAFGSVVPAKYNVNLVSGTSQTQKLTVNNTSNSDVRVSTRLYRLNDHYSNRSQVYSIQDSSVTYTPSQFSIPPNSSKTITINLVAPIRTTEQAYQLELLPMAPKQVQQTIAYDDNGMPNQSASMGLMLSQRINIHAMPSQISTTVGSARGENSVTLTNKGNASIYLSSLQRCRPEGGCASDKSFIGSRLYPSQSITIGNINPSYKISLNKKSIKVDGTEITEDIIL